MCMWIKPGVTDMLPLYPITWESEAGGKASLDYIVKPYLQELKIKKRQVVGIKITFKFLTEGE